MSKLVLFTSSFPYGSKETYLETEIQHLSNSFDVVEIFPHYYNNGSTKKRNVPENVKVNRPVLSINKSIRVFRAVIGLVNGARVNHFISDFFKSKVYRSRKNFMNWGLTLMDYSSMVVSDQFKLLHEKDDCVFYYYWGSGWVYSLLNIDSKKRVKSCFVRLHGGEVYLERSNGYIPLRNLILNKADYLLPISSQLRSYINRTFRVPKEKIVVSRLGVCPSEIVSSPPKNDLIRIVSCSNVISLKRLHKIVEALKLIEGREVEWIHFGDGPLLADLRKRVESQNFNLVIVHFKGRVSNQNVLKFYRENEVSGFINVSKYEGVPFSIMEAMSYGIPCIATDAGATSELVNNENGILLDNSFEICDLVSAIERIDSIEWDKKRKIAYDHCNHLFNADLNYNSLCSTLNNSLD